MDTERLFLKTLGLFGVIYPLFQENTKDFAAAMVVSTLVLVLGFVKGEPLGGTQAASIDDD